MMRKEKKCQRRKHERKNKKKYTPFCSESKVVSTPYIPVAIVVSAVSNFKNYLHKPFACIAFYLRICMQIKRQNKYTKWQVAGRKSQIHIKSR